MTAQESRHQAALTYTSYLKLDELLSLQSPRSEGPEHDETLFIVIHQVYELWFKQLIHEIGGMQAALENGDTAGAMHLARRILTILKTVVAQIDVLETMTPRSFASFRSRLESASGFQSAQFRVFEALLGRRDRRVLDAYEPGSPAYRSIVEAMGRPSLYGSFLRYLARTGHPVPQAALDHPPGLPREPSPEVQDVLVQAYLDDPIAAQLGERLVDIDEGVQEWRYRHVKMVERTIGSKPGTGGSSGAAYLRSTLFTPAFPDLWEIRSRF